MGKYPMPSWLDQAYRFRGLREIPGKQHNPTILRWLKSLKAWWAEDETPWCGTFVAECMRVAGIALPKHWYRAGDWASWGVPVSPRVGAVMVKARKGGHHVFFYAGETDTHYLGLGGNQSNCVNITPFHKSEVIACRWPVGIDAQPFKSNLVGTSASLAMIEGKAGGSEA